VAETDAPNTPATKNEIVMNLYFIAFYLTYVNARETEKLLSATGVRGGVFA
jgi:hypothetical protein